MRVDRVQPAGMCLIIREMRERGNETESHDNTYEGADDPSDVIHPSELPSHAGEPTNVVGILGTIVSRAVGDRRAINRTTGH